MKTFNYFLILLIFIPIITKAQKFIPSEYYKVEVICDELNEEYFKDNEEGFFPISTSFGNNASVYENYIYYLAQGNVYRLSFDASDVDLLYGTYDRDYRINHKFPLNSFSMHDSILTVFDMYKWEFLMSKDRGKNWSVIHKITPDEDSLYTYFLTFDENNHFRVFYEIDTNQIKTYKLAITNDKFATLDTVDLRSLVPDSLNTSISCHYGLTPNEIYIFISHWYYQINENKQDTLALLRTKMIMTSNSGKTWESKNTDTQYNNSPDVVKIFDDSIFLLGKYQVEYGKINSTGASINAPFGNIKLSTDNGDTWNNVIQLDSFPYPFVYYDMWDTQTIFFSSSFNGSKFQFYYSLDGGKRFYKFDISNFFNPYGGLHGWILLDSRTMYLTAVSSLIRLEFLTETDVIENLPEEYKIFPNPAQDFITISDDNIHKYQTYEISDLMGRAVQSGTLESDKIMLEDFPAGIYFLKLIGTTETKSMKFVVGE